MTRPPFTWLREVIAIDTVANEVVAVRSKKVRGQLRHERLAALPSQMPDIPVIACLSNQESIVRRIEAPYANRAKARRVFPTLLDLRLPFAESDCLYDFLDEVLTDQGGTQALAVAARRTTIRDYLEKCHTRMMDPLVLDQEAVALWTQSLLERPPAADSAKRGLQLVISLHGNHATLCVGSNNHLLAAGNLAGDIVADLNRRINALDFKIDPEIPADVRWTGPGTADAVRLTDLMNAFDATRTANHFTHTEPDLMLARALATRAMRPGPCRCNLRSGPECHPALLRRYRQHSLISASIVALTGAFLLAIGHGWQHYTAEYHRRLQQTVVQQAENILGQPTALRGQDAVNQVQRYVENLDLQTRPQADLIPATQSDNLTAVLNAAHQKQVTVHALKIDNQSLSLQGSVAVWANAAAFADDLKLRFPPFELQRHWDASPHDDLIQFSITPSRSD